MIGKTSAYEGSIKVPLVVRGPGIPENETREQLVNNLDVVATIVELAGATPGLTLDGALTHAALCRYQRGCAERTSH